MDDLTVNIDPRTPRVFDGPTAMVHLVQSGRVLPARPFPLRVVHFLLSWADEVVSDFDATLTLDGAGPLTDRSPRQGHLEAILLGST